MRVVHPPPPPPRNRKVTISKHLELYPAAESAGQGWRTVSTGDLPCRLRSIHPYAGPYTQSGFSPPSAKDWVRVRGEVDPNGPKDAKWAYSKLTGRLSIGFGLVYEPLRGLLVVDIVSSISGILYLNGQ
jgi:hypothetical protein